MENKTYDVVIIGCGSFGIGAATELLSQSNLTFMILEARDRVEGRAYTDQHSLKSSFDVGAEWTHQYGPDNALNSFHEQLKTELDNDYYIQLFDPTTSVGYDSDGSNIAQQICTQAQKTINRLFSQYISNDKDKDISIYDTIEQEFNRLEDS
ncbi:unnamed protein product [Rotaria sp. Silwood1]|nr:unnamed protein product [Rotaria sp. Silwood1]